MPPPEETLPASNSRTDIGDSPPKDSMPPCFLADPWKPKPEDWPKLKLLEGTDFTSSELLVFAALCDFANPYVERWPPWVPKMQGFASWIGIPRICRVTGLSDRAVQLALKALRARNAIQSIYQSKGGAARKQGEQSGPPRTNCYLLTPNHVHRYSAETPNVVHRSEHTEPRTKKVITPNGSDQNPERSSPYNPEPRSPELLTLHHHQEERKEERNKKPDEQILPPSIRADDDRRTKRRRAPLEDPFEELALRFRERFGSGAEAILRIVLDGISPKRQEVQDFADFDEAHTGAPQDLTNPGGYYRTLVVKFQLAQANKRERQRLERQRELERHYAAPAEPKPECPLGRCDGSGEVYEPNGRVSGACECEAGQRLHPAVREMLPLLKQGAA